MNRLLRTAQSRVERKLDRYPLLKLDLVMDWKPIYSVLKQTKASQVNAHKARGGYDLLKMFKAILLGQWHSLSDPELEKALSVRIDFILFCGFDDEEIPDETTLCRFRNWLVSSQLMDPLLRLVNQQLEQSGLYVRKADVAIVDATIIQTAGAKSAKNPIITEEGQIIDPPPSKDMDAQWTKKGHNFHLSYKTNIRTSKDGFIESIHTVPANVHDSQLLESVLDHTPKGTRVLADKGYASKHNREALNQRGLKDGIMHKAYRNKPMKQSQKRFNRMLSKTRYVVEQCFGTLKRRFRFERASYFGLNQVHAQITLKAICLNLLKASNRLLIA